MKTISLTPAKYLMQAVLPLLLWAASTPSAYAQDYFKKPGNDNWHIANAHNLTSATQKLAAEITAGASNDYEKVKAIYAWICSHIDYDTSYSIRTADECLKRQKGVCQAYCELFYLLAKAAGVRVEIVEGQTKDETGYINPSGHGWIFAYTRQDHGILMDPTWGAGSVAGDKFVRSDNCWQWFNVHPEWMILSHFPKDKSYQLIDSPMAEKEFLALPPVNTLWLEYGVDVHEVFKNIRANTLSLPQFYNDAEGQMSLIEFPMSERLAIGVDYTFRVKVKSERDFGIMNGDVFCKKSEWKDEGDGIYSVNFMPTDTTSLTLCIRNQSNTTWNTVVKYGIMPTTPMQWDMVARFHPESLPEMKAVKNLNANLWAAAGITRHKLLQMVREQHLTELPNFYENKSKLFTVISVPMSKRLKAGETCHFRFLPKVQAKWAVVNGSDWYTDWQVDDNGLHELTVSPKVAGRLSLYVQQEGEASFWPCLEYTVE